MLSYQAFCLVGRQSRVGKVKQHFWWHAKVLPRALFWYNLITSCTVFAAEFVV